MYFKLFQFIFVVQVASVYKMNAPPTFFNLIWNSIFKCLLVFFCYVSENGTVHQNVQFVFSFQWTVRLSSVRFVSFYVRYIFFFHTIRLIFCWQANTYYYVRINIYSIFFFYRLWSTMWKCGVCCAQCPSACTEKIIL